MDSLAYKTEIIRPRLTSIETNGPGVAELLSFYQRASSSTSRSITYDLQNVIHFDANLSAIFLGCVQRLRYEQNKRVFLEVPKHMNVLFRNGLISHLSGQGNFNKYEDSRESTIPLRSFELKDDEQFSSYLHNDFFGHRGLYSLPTSTKRHLRTQFIEVFNNAELHSNAKHPVYTCGQYFPQQGTLKFTMIDLGDGFLKKINAFTGGTITTDSAAIEWALSKNNTTKEPNFGPGGTGLKDLKRYCEEHNGSLQIASGKNFMTFVKGRIVDNLLQVPVHGAVVNLIFRQLE